LPRGIINFLQLSNSIFGFPRRERGHQVLPLFVQAETVQLN